MMVSRCLITLSNFGQTQIAVDVQSAELAVLELDQHVAEHADTHIVHVAIAHGELLQRVRLRHQRDQPLLEVACPLNLFYSSYTPSPGRPARDWSASDWCSAAASRRALPPSPDRPSSPS